MVALFMLCLNTTLQCCKNAHIITIKKLYKQIQIRMLRKAIKVFCSDSASHLRQLLRKCQTLQQQISVNDQKLTTLKQQFAGQQKKLSDRNKQILQLRSQLTRDVKRGEEIWASARNKSQLHRKQSIQNFAAGLTGLLESIKEVKNFEKQQSDADVKEGFDLTSRLFNSTLQKYKIASFEPAVKAKFNKQEMICEGQVKTENEKQKGTVAKVTKQGYKVQNKIIHKAKVQVYN